MQRDCLVCGRALLAFRPALPTRLVSSCPRANGRRGMLVSDIGGDVQRACVFSGSRPGRRPEYAAAARALGKQLARRGIGLVYGGASVGVMREVADATLAAGGEVIGVIPQALLDREVAHHGLTELRVVPTMHVRKATMESLASSFVALPGGFGTLDELFEILTWAQLGIHQKPVGLLDTAGFWQPLVSLVDHMVREEFIPEGQTRLFVVDADPESLLDKLAAWTPPLLGPKWVERSAT